MTAAIDEAGCAAALGAGPGEGAVVVFVGRARNHHRGRPVRHLEYEAYGRLAEREGERILAEARDRFGLAGAFAVHRLGRVEPGEPAVWVGVAAAHRGPAFEACRWIIDALKERVPIWKRETWDDDGTADWVVPGAS